MGGFRPVKLGLSSPATRHRPRLNCLMMSSILGAFLMGCSSACGGSSTLAVVRSPTPTQATIASPTPIQAVVPSPTPDSITRNYIALIHNYWIQMQAAEFSNGINVAARVCLGISSPAAPSNLLLIDAQTCHVTAVAMLAVQQKFLRELRNSRTPQQFVADDQAIRSQLPKAVTALKALISVAATGTNDAVLQAATTYVDDVIPLVTNALDDIDPSVVHT